jgi:signal transduction histidine kinase
MEQVVPMEQAEVATFPEPLNRLSREDLGQLEQYLERVRFEPGECILQAGAVADSCYLIDEGVVRIEIPRTDVDLEGVVDYVTAGSMLGELGLLDRLPRSASAYAETPIAARRIPAAAVEQLCIRQPRIGAALVAALGRDAALKLRQLHRSRERIVRGREEERRRLRRDLHDDLGPTLAGMTMQVGAMRALLEDREPPVAELLAYLEEQLRHCIAEVRGLIDDLRPPDLEFGLLEAIRRRCVAFADGSLLISVDSTPRDFGSLPAAIEVAAYRIAVEAVTNVVRHAAASRCRVSLTLGDALQIDVVDDGTGLPDHVSAGMGIPSMRERAVEVGGVCTLARGPAGGTHLCARLPLEQRQGSTG